jgi:divalent metal cation (Fe/Co/Zn/Cd) transporter
MDPELAASGLRIKHAYDASPVRSRLSGSYDRLSASPPNTSSSSANTGRTDLLSPTFSLTTPADAYSPFTPQSAISEGDELSDKDEEPATNPFNFTTQQYSAARSPAKTVSILCSSTTSRLTHAQDINVGKRRGHKYKHSSVSHQIFVEPTPRAPLQLPASLPVPTRNEVQHSMTSNQKARLSWCICHFLIAVYVQWSASGSLAMTALSRLLFFDAIGAIACVLVETMGNFEVWKRSTVKHPFGLERLDVLVGFGLAVFIGFMGLDVLSHGIQHSLENLGSHVAHSPHAHRRISAGSIDVAALLAVLVTLISAVVLKNHARIGKVMRLDFIACLGTVLSNPSHLITLSCSTLMLLLPLLSIQAYHWFDAAMSFAIAISMMALGIRLGMSLSSILLMSYSAPAGSATVKEVISEIETDRCVSAVQDAKFWQVHYGLCMANLTLRCRAADYGTELAKTRERISSLVRNRLGGGYGSGGLKWEVSIQLILERD